MSRDSGFGDFLAGFLLGGLVGAAVALLFAPQSGEETVSMIREKGIELKDRVGEIRPEDAKKAIKQAFDEAISEGRQAAERAREEMMARFGQGKGAAPEAAAPQEITLP